MLRGAAGRGSTDVAPEDTYSKRKAEATSSPFTRLQDSSQRSKHTLCWIGIIIAVVMLINYNTSRGNVRVSTGLGSAKTQDAVASKGYSELVSGGRLTTAAAQQGSNQCVSTYKVPPDTATAMCQAFCSIKFKKFHCMWCKCRACSFCPKGGEAIEEAAKDSSPPPPASPPPDTNTTAVLRFHNAQPLISPSNETVLLHGANTTEAGIANVRPSSSINATFLDEPVTITPPSDVQVTAATPTGESGQGSTTNTTSMLLQTDTVGVNGVKDPIVAAAAAAVDAQPPVTTAVTPAAAIDTSRAAAARQVNLAASEAEASVASTAASKEGTVTAPVANAEAAADSSITSVVDVSAESGAQAQAPDGGTNEAPEEEIDQELRDPSVTADASADATATA